MPVVEKIEIVEQNVGVESIDLLNRQPFVNQLINVANMLADNKKNACYAINGGWGVGKTYVLDMFEKQIRDYTQEETTLSKFLVLHYNCWQYDYYEEPLIAIVSAIMDAIDEEVCLLPTEIKNFIKTTLREVAKEILNETNHLISAKTGVNISRWISVTKRTTQETEEQTAEEHRFDTYFEFKKKLKKLQETIRDLSTNQTILFVVDELDRCLPEYAIKVLERLHHIFDDIPNVQVVLSVDKKQLENTVSQIYGVETRVDTYLAKFIDFEVYLNEGSVKENFELRFKEYVQNFEIVWKETKAMDVDRFITRLLEGISTRQRIALIEKSQMIHDLVSSPEKMDTSIMCIELFLALLQSCGLHQENAKKYFNFNNMFVTEAHSAHPVIDNTTAGLGIVGLQYRNVKPDSVGGYWNRDPNIERHYINCRDVYGIVLGAYRRILKFESDFWMTGSQDKYLIEEHVDKFWETLQIIK